jgi:hypothetical protein
VPPNAHPSCLKTCPSRPYKGGKRAYPRHAFGWRWAAQREQQLPRNRTKRYCVGEEFMPKPHQPFTAGPTGHQSLGQHNNIKYTRRADEDGWLAVLVESSKTRIALCEYTKVVILQETPARTFFKISDGNSGYIGATASLSRQNAEKYLLPGGPFAPARVNVKYEGSPSPEDSPFKGHLLQQWAKLTFPGGTATVTLNSVWDGRYTPIAAGSHKIMAPDYSHAAISTLGYRESAPPGQIRCTDVWFPIEVQGTPSNSGRYIHIGHLSEGCITVHELLKWTSIYDFLISRREPESAGRYIGNVAVEK